MLHFLFLVGLSSPPSPRKSTTTTEPSTTTMSTEPSTTARPLCEGFTCPNNELNGGLHPYDKDGCSSQFCDCVQGNTQQASGLQKLF